MDFLDKLGKKVTETYNVASEKTSKLAREAKLKMLISEAESNIEKEYAKIGKKVFEMYLDKRDDDIALKFIEEFKTIDKEKDIIQQSENEISNMKEKNEE